MYDNLFYLGTFKRILRGVKNDTFPVSLGRLYKPVDNLDKLCKAAGLWISLQRIFHSSPKNVTFCTSSNASSLCPPPLH